mmetsp:Transcript_125413/g.360329  ORF Transcript_125413/g.360329 Transcript_125413/m.360329 type:complete len:342 (-) Transcript_125413:398-1423(-)
MPVACYQLPAAAVGQRHMACVTALLTASAAINRAKHLVSAGAYAQCPVLGSDGEHLEFVNLGGRPCWVHGVHDCVAHGPHHGLALRRAELADDLQLLRHLVVLQGRRVELQAELVVAIADLQEGVRAQLLFAPFENQALQAEVRTHHGVAAANRKAHEAHRGRCSAFDRDFAPSAARPSLATTNMGALAGAARKTVVTAGGTTLPIQHDAVWLHRSQVLEQLQPRSGGSIARFTPGLSNCADIAAAGAARGAPAEAGQKLGKALAGQAVGADTLARNGDRPHLAKHLVIGTALVDGNDDSDELVTLLLVGREQLPRNTTRPGSPRCLAAAGIRAVLGVGAV